MMQCTCITICRLNLYMQYKFCGISIGHLPVIAKLSVGDYNLSMGDICPCIIQMQVLVACFDFLGYHNYVFHVNFML